MKLYIFLYIRIISYSPHQSKQGTTPDEKKK